MIYHFLNVATNTTEWEVKTGGSTETECIVNFIGGEESILGIHISNGATIIRYVDVLIRHALIISLVIG